MGKKRFFKRGAVFALALFAIAWSGAVRAGDVDPDLLRRLGTGDILSFTRAFEMRPKVSDANRAAIDAAIGDGIIAKPRNFLQALKDSRGKIKNLGRMLSAVNEDLESDSLARKAEIERRLEAIKSVKAVKLKDVATECRVQLAEALKKFE